ncbi:hypothetical protein O181_009111 [Austropuccinia psidii MF-1]|uniref:Uncharacterized protein n=1 Tax=Austropuccinia psidii MF-1 TaxID=1389203 RepID=A0A9Q3BNQ2_9BASI|nr:hypothetical protein [Austropuccinia psidii MF-1]
MPTTLVRRWAGGRCVCNVTDIPSMTDGQILPGFTGSNEGSALGRLLVSEGQKVAGQDEGRAQQPWYVQYMQKVTAMPILSVMMSRIYSASARRDSPLPVVVSFEKQPTPFHNLET